jgi:myo-inositol-1(or 4)-monophosphatase
MAAHKSNHSLKGVSILITRPKSRAQNLAKGFKRLGAKVTYAPLIKSAPPSSWKSADKAIACLTSFDALIFTSTNGVAAFFDRLRTRKTAMPSKIRTYAVGPATQKALRSRGIKGTVIPEKYEGGELARRLGRVRGKKVLIARAQIAREALPKLLRARGAKVTIAHTYRTVSDPQGCRALKRAAKSANIDWITFTSGSTVNTFVETLGIRGAKHFLTRTKAASIGPITTQRLYAKQLPPSAEAQSFTSEGIIQAVLDKSAVADSRDIRNTLLRSLKEAGKIAGEYFGRVTPHYKGRANIVTKADLACEQKILDIVLKKFPHHGFITEERPPRIDGSDYSWIIDPIDGTNNYAHTFPVSCISIAVAHRNKTIFAGIYDPFRKELFFAEKGKGATLNGRPMHVSKTKKLSEALLLTGFPYDRAKRGGMYLSICRRFLQRCHGLRRSGSAALDLAWAAAGRVDGFWEFKLNPWDVAAGALIVTEAGGRLSDFNGKPFTNPATDGQTTLVSNGNIHNAMLSILRGKK